jgi:hypothetical protein
MRRAPLPLFVLVFLTAAAPPKVGPPPFEAGAPYLDVQEALADSKRLTGEEARYTRYLSLRALRSAPPEDQKLFKRILDHIVNSLSSEAYLEPLRVVSPDLLALNTVNYGRRFHRVWERLAEFDPYYHLEIRKKSQRSSGKRRSPDVPGKPRPKRKKRARKKIFALAPWLDATQSAELAGRTHTQVPVVRADWFARTVLINADRGRVGYYSFLGVKNRADVERLAGLDRRKARDLRREVAAILRRSGVAQNNRQIFRFGAVDSGFWQTLDVFDNSKKRRNAIRNLDEDFQHDAEEIYFVLANDLFGYALAAVNGDLQDSAPDKVGPDTTSTSNDGRIHVFLSCVRCHREGLRPINDYSRRLYSNSVTLTVLRDHKNLNRLKQLYLRPLEDFIDRDRDRYARATWRLTGLKTREVARGYRRLWKWANDDDVSLDQAARELGVPPKYVVTVLRKIAKSPSYGQAGVGFLDPVLAAFLPDKPHKLLRDHFEESYPLLQTHLKGYIPKLKIRK